MCGFVVSCVVTAGLCSCRVRCFVSCPVVNVFALGCAWFWVGLVGVVTCDVSLLLHRARLSASALFVKILLCRGGVSGVLWVCCVSRFVVYVIAYAARMRAQEGGGALIVLCAVVSLMP